MGTNTPLLFNFNKQMSTTAKFRDAQFEDSIKFLPTAKYRKFHSTGVEVQNVDNLTRARTKTKVYSTLQLPSSLKIVLVITF